MSVVLDQFPVKPMTGTAQKIGNKRIRLAPRISLGEITPNNVGTLKKLNMGLFPVAYSDKFYKEVLNPDVEDYCKLIFYQDLAVGSIVCRIESTSTPPPITLSTSVSPSILPVASSSSSTTVVLESTPATGPHKLYIMTLGILAPYRRQGLASKLINQVIQAAEATHRPPVAEVYKIKPKEELVERKSQRGVQVPVAVVVKKAIVTQLYLHVQVSNEEAKKFWEGNGFKVTGTIKNYYRKIEPRDAWVLERDIVVAEE